MVDYERLDKFIEYQRDIQTKEHKDIFCPVTGDRGDGKSTFAIQAARLYAEKYFGERHFSFKKYVAYTNNGVYQKMINLPIYSPLIADEAIRFAWSRDWYTSESKDLIKLGTQVRTKHLIFYLNLPRLVWLDKPYREGLVNMWVWVISVDTQDEGRKSYAIVF